MGPLFSIITVCYNSALTIEKTLQSVLNQTCTDYEYIIVDGKSTDETLNIVKQYEPLFEGKMEIISEPDQGIYDAMNKGIECAKGKLIGLVNSDDYYEPDTLENVKKAYLPVAVPKCILFGLVRGFHNGKEKIIYLKHPDFIEDDMIAHPACFVSEEVYREYGGYSLEYKYSSDYEFMLRIREDKDIKYIEVLNVLSNFSLDGISSTAFGYYETMKLKHEYHLINDFQYIIIMFKKFLKKILGRAV